MPEKKENPVYARFVTEMQVRPDDIDLYSHVHSSRYLDYVLAARFDQMTNCYKMSMQDFAARGFGWFQRSLTINYKRQLEIAERFKVETGIEEFLKDGVIVSFKIFKANGKIAADGVCNYALIDMNTRRAAALPQDILEKYSI
ncbi:MAG: acyl-CoA thioesterase [Opitutales bacterium]|nr:acyl-CoA thioesterase [Opitutales bacterium]